MVIAADAHQLVERKTQIVFAADQEPFHNAQGQRFCVLRPLMTSDGSTFKNVDEMFPSRGRVWWMVRSELHKTPIRPGRIFTGQIEAAFKGGKDDIYQVVPRSVQPNARGFVDIIDVPEQDPNIARLCAQDGLVLSRQPLPTVVIRGRRFAYGPFRVQSADDERFELSAPNATDPIVFRFESRRLQAVGSHEFQFVGGQHDPQAVETNLRLSLVRETDLQVVLDEADPVDAMSEVQLIRWALDIADFDNRQRQEFRDALGSVREVHGDTERELARMTRFRSLCEDAERVSKLGSDVASMIAEAPHFQSLVQQHVERIAAEEIRQRIEQAKDQIVRQTEQARSDKERIEGELRTVEEELERRRQAHDAKLDAQRIDVERALAAREAEVAEKEAEAAARQEALEERLAENMATYREQIDDVVRQVTLFEPILQRLNSRPSAGPNQVRPQTSDTIERPAWRRPVEPGTLDQSEFLNQLRRVVDRRGFVFADQDLVQFHVSALVGTWTVIAGQTGLGKSSLPRLYAEALGMRERYLKVPVQPDWLDDRDVLGAYNTIAGHFEPAANGLVDHLIHAYEDYETGCHGTYFICLDEMNLSRVEHYFARFLSILEDPVEQRIIPLYSGNRTGEPDPYKPYQRLPIRENVRFFGTVNVDETTHFFSPKVLDRAILMSLSPPDLQSETGRQTHAENLSLQPVPNSTWASWYRGADSAEPATREVLVQLDSTLREMRSGIGYRLRDRILALTATATPLLSHDTALDLAIASSALPRIHTHHPRFHDLVDQLLKTLEPFQVSHGIVDKMRNEDQGGDFFEVV